MQTRNLMTKWLGLIISLTVVGMAGVRVETAGAQPSVLSGWLHVIWADPVTGSVAEPGPRYVLIDDQEQWTEITLDETRLRSLGGPLAFNRKRVTVAGVWEEASPEGRKDTVVRQPRFRADEIQVESPLESSVDALTVTPEAAPLALGGSQPWVTILCRFADTPTVTPRPKSYFDSLLTGVYPGLDHYWREVSYDNINIAGSVVVGWYNLPQPRSYYVYDQNGDGLADLDFSRARNDCTAVADAAVFFPNFVGVNLMFNQNLDCCAWGGSTTLTRDGQTKFYRITWMPPWGYANQDVIGHEMGHGFGLPHSSGPYTATYDSYWDVMSGGGICTPPDATYGCIGVHTISYHKDFLGWVPSARKYLATPGSSQTIVLERLGQPLFNGNYLMAQIPIGGSTTQFYTVEARRFPGYDNQIPGEAVVIHKVDTTRSDRVARVVDSDGNGNPNDAGARWTPGETFTDPANGVTVTVNAATTAGFSVTLGYIGAGTSGLAASVAPSSRSVQMGMPATTFAAVSNSDSTSASNVGVTLKTNVPGTFTFWPIDLSVNPPVFGAQNTPITIPAGGLQYYFLAIWPNVSFSPTEVQFNFAGTNALPAPIFSGLNTLLLSASPTQPSDVIASLATCPSDDGVPLTVNLPGSTGVTGFVAPMINIGSAGQVTVSANTVPTPGTPTLPVKFFLCQTDAVGTCVNPPGGYSSGPVTMTIGSGQKTSFNILAQGTGGTIAFNPVANRVFIIVTEGTETSGPNRGLVSAAIRTHSPACAP